MNLNQRKNRHTLISLQGWRQYYLSKKGLSHKNNLEPKSKRITVVSREFERYFCILYRENKTHRETIKEL
jgi:hypothetical protein